MKTLKLPLIVVLAMCTLFLSGCSQDGKEIQNYEDQNFGITPSLVPVIALPTVEPVEINPWPSGDAASECAEAETNCDFSWKIDEAPTNRTYHTDTGEFGNTPTSFDAAIVISNSDGTTFDWSSDYQVCAVIVKGGPGANVYYYPDGSCGDTGLSAPINPSNGTPYGLSHVTFCFSATPCDEEPEDCYEEETAWATGPRYTERGNWATYTPYPGDGESVDIYSGRTRLTGSVTFNDNGDGTVDLDFELINGFIFYYDMGDDTADDNVKIQDYESAPSGNPAPGLFDTKASVAAGETIFSITVPMNNYYGIHLDVAQYIPCDDD